MFLKVTKKQTRGFLLTKQLLVQNPKTGYKGIKHVFDTLRTVQYDPLNPCGRNSDLVLQARVKNYHPEDYYKWLYEDRLGIECYDKMLCIVPIEDNPFTSHNRKYIADHPEVKKFFRKNKKDFKELLVFIKNNGPVSSGMIDSNGKSTGRNWHGGTTRWGKQALEYLWKTGQVVIAKRINGNKYYDLPEKVYGAKYMNDVRHVEREHILRRTGSVGMMKAHGMSDAWRGIGDTKIKNEIVGDLIESGELLEVEIENVKTRYVIQTADKKIFEACRSQKKIKYRPEMRFIAPLDTLIWDRNMIEEIFDFHYRWEVYVPAAKREFGYYVLPILYKDRFVGRIEPVLQNKTLTIKNVWKEKGAEWSAVMEKELEKAIKRFGEYLRVD